MKLLLINTSMVVLLGTALFGQSTPIRSSSLPPSAIDGSKNPELIPDTVALRLIFSALRLSDDGFSSDANGQPLSALVKQEIRLKRIGLSRLDKEAVQTVISDFDSSLRAWETKTSNAIQNNEVFVISPDMERDQIVLHTRDVLKQRLSPEGWDRFTKYVSNAKRTMIVWP